MRAHATGALSGAIKVPWAVRDGVSHDRIVCLRHAQLRRGLLEGNAGPGLKVLMRAGRVVQVREL